MSRSTQPISEVGLSDPSAFTKALFKSALHQEGGNPLQMVDKPLREKRKNIHQTSFASTVRTEPARELRAKILSASLFPNIYMPKKIGKGSPEDLP